MKFEDVDGDGVRDAGEPGLPGATIFLDRNANGVLDAGEPASITDATGRYAFADLTPGADTVAEVCPAGSAPRRRRRPAR